MDKGPLTVYEFICLHVPAAEHAEIKRVLGQLAVEENATLMEESRALRTIAQELDVEITDAMLHREAQINLVEAEASTRAHNHSDALNMNGVSGLPSPAISPPKRAIDFAHGEGMERDGCSSMPANPILAGLTVGKIRPVSVANRKEEDREGWRTALSSVHALGMCHQMCQELRHLLQEEKRALEVHIETLRLQLEDSIQDWQEAATPAPKPKPVKDFKQNLQRSSVGNAIDCPCPMAETDTYQAESGAFRRLANALHFGAEFVLQGRHP